MLLVLLAFAALAAFVFGQGVGEAVTESDDGQSGKTTLDTLAQALGAGAKSVEAWANGALLGIITVVPIGGGYYLRADAAESWLRLKSAAVTSEVYLVLDSAFRSMPEQLALYSDKLSGKLTQLVAKPGYSNHQQGDTVDVAVGGVSTSLTYRWLATNAPAFGWVNEGASFSAPEYWHWRYHPDQDEYA